MKIKIAILVERGVVWYVYSNKPGIEITVIDVDDLKADGKTLGEIIDLVVNTVEKTNMKHQVL